MVTVPHILVSDDDSALRDVVCEGLASRGWVITPTRDGAEAIEVLSHRGDIHLCLLDLHMPRADGLQVIRFVHQQRPTRGPADAAPLPCVLMSAELSDQTRIEATRFERCQVLDKPFRLSRLSQVIGNTLAEAYGWTGRRPDGGFAAT